MTTKRDPQTLLPLTPAMFFVLVALADGQTHGYAILKDVEALTNGSVRLSTGTLYGIVKRLLADGLIRKSEGSAEPTSGADPTTLRRSAARLRAPRQPGWRKHCQSRGARRCFDGPETGAGVRCRSSVPRSFGAGVWCGSSVPEFSAGV